MVGYSGSPENISEYKPMPQIFIPSRPMRHGLAELMIMSNLLQKPYGSNEDLGTPMGLIPGSKRIQHKGFTGERWSKRKSRSKIAKQSKKRNRG